ncbi:MAG: hypothetical protein JXA53_08315 [Bacteroidales bacterium]|nr:hypothetical protein [Bacteroidales bacterium]
MDSKKKYYFTDDIEKLGQFSINHKDGRYTKEIMQAAFKIVRNECDLKQSKLIPGYLDRNKTFFECPIIVFYIKITGINLELPSKEDYYSSNCKLKKISISLEIFDKEFTNSIQYDIVKSYYYNTVEILLFNDSINMLNEYIESGRDINKLCLKGSGFSKTRLDHRAIILNAVQQLTFEVYEDSSTCVGKDNVFWTELVVSNLPNNSYLKELIITCLAKQGVGIKSEKSSVSVILLRYTVWTASYKRRLIPDYNVAEIIDFLKLDMAMIFNSKEYILSNMEKTI